MLTDPCCYQLHFSAGSKTAVHYITNLLEVCRTNVVATDAEARETRKHSMPKCLHSQQSETTCDKEQLAALEGQRSQRHKESTDIK